MLAYHNDVAVKDKYVRRVLAHQAADEIEKGFYWTGGRGCAVGCTIHGNNHKAYETELGIPQLLARLEDGIFENLPLQRAKLWPAEFLQAVNVGADLSGIWPKFAIWMLTDKEWGVIQFAKTELTKTAIQNISDAYDKYDLIKPEEWHSLRRAAYAAAADAAAAAAAYAAAADAAAYAAAADADADAYAAAADAAADAAGARRKWRVAQADKLLELLRDCK